MNVLAEAAWLYLVVIGVHIHPHGPVESLALPLCISSACECGCVYVSE